MYLEAAFNVDAKNEDHMAIYGTFCPLTDHLQSGDDEAEETQEPIVVTPEQREIAEQFKTQGNTLMTQGDTHGAIVRSDIYTDAFTCTILKWNLLNWLNGYDG